MNISYELWPIWCDYLEEQGQDTELLRYILTWGIFNNKLGLIGTKFRDTDNDYYWYNTGDAYCSFYGVVDYRSNCQLMICEKIGYAYGTFLGTIGFGTYAYD